MKHGNTLRLEINIIETKALLGEGLNILLKQGKGVEEDQPSLYFGI